MRRDEKRTARDGTGARTSRGGRAGAPAAAGGALLLGAMIGALLVGCAGPSGPHASASGPAASGSASASPAGSPSPGSTATASDPSASPGAPTALPAGAARRWVSPADPALAVDLRTPGTIGVGAGCLSFTGALTTTTAPSDPSAGTPAGPTVGIAIAPKADGKVHCMGFSIEQQDFVGAVRQATTLTVVGDRLLLSGGGTSLQLTAA